jgi:hypothetical protein
MLLWLAGLAALGLFVALACMLAPLRPSILALQFAFTPSAFARVVHAWPDAQLQRYLEHLRWDYLLLSCYAAFGWLLATRSRLFDAQRPALRRAAKWLLPAAAGFDALENALHGWLAAAPRFGVGWLYALSATSSSLKWLLLLAFGALVARALAGTRVKAG